MTSVPATAPPKQTPEQSGSAALAMMFNAYLLSGVPGGTSTVTFTYSDWPLSRVSCDGESEVHPIAGDCQARGTSSVRDIVIARGSLPESFTNQGTTSAWPGEA